MVKACIEYAQPPLVGLVASGVKLMIGFEFAPSTAWNAFSI